jgi:hypothetical protein
MELKNFWCRYWVSEEGAPNFGYVGPWWITSVEQPVLDEDVAGICFAIRAENQEAVDEWFRDKFDEGDVRQKVYIHEMEQEWIPFNEDYPKSDWMVWPYRYVSLDKGFPGLYIGDTEVEVNSGELKISEAFIPAEPVYGSEFGVGDTVMFVDPTQGGIPVKCIVGEIAGAAVKLIPVDGESAEWDQVVAIKEMVSKYEEQ